MNCGSHSSAFEHMRRWRAASDSLENTVETLPRSTSNRLSMLCGFVLRGPKILPTERIAWLSIPTRTVSQKDGVTLSAVRVSGFAIAISFIALAANQNCVASPTCVSKSFSAFSKFWSSAGMAIGRSYRATVAVDPRFPFIGFILKNPSMPHNRVTADSGYGFASVSSVISLRESSNVRSEERRVGKECRSRGWPYQYKKSDSNQDK